MVTVTQFVYVKEGKEEIFQQFESLVLPLIPRYNGKLLLRLRLGPEQLIEGELEAPYEVHLVSFGSDADLAAYMSDQTREKNLYLKEESILKVLTVRQS
ncbi:hypothetical protein GCM10010967_14550 [Dyadobacter beijingensis]|uniref:DUF1330 domain-containing protein n=1 Tax=Dyadobacter beijingensis TaxID=365489 RepID=A0ABQ2HLC0_9BACT|nr:hypothetical protein [Dyadobacter beijingensis]GGM83810.1 hypothetical protein GCM10010967_14550 [Dyadobacter beijingensis]